MLLTRPEQPPMYGFGRNIGSCVAVRPPVTAWWSRLGESNPGQPHYELATRSTLCSERENALRRGAFRADLDGLSHTENPAVQLRPSVGSAPVATSYRSCSARGSGCPTCHRR